MAEATNSPARCPVTPDTASRLASAGLSSFGTEADALTALAASGDVALDGAPDCVGQYGKTPWCDGCVFAADCATVAPATPVKCRRRRPPPPASR
jgi:hypothetical protein